jgi:putative ABC transport system permease protein
MIIHYIKTTLKQFGKAPLFSFINLFGLSMSMAVCLLIVLYVFREMRFDRFHEDAASIHRVNIHINMQGEEYHEPFTSAPMGPDLTKALPEITGFTRISNYQQVNVWQDDRYTTVGKTLDADSTFFEMFSFRLLRGNPVNALAEPFSLVLTESLAQRLFPGQDPMGKLIRLDDGTRHYRITGIAADCPPYSHMQFELLRSFSTRMVSSRANFTDWDAAIHYFTYVRLARGTDKEALTPKIAQLTDEKLNYKFEGVGVNVALSLIPVTDIRMHSPFINEMEEAGTSGKVWMFSLVAVFVLFIAGFNYVNLTIARSGVRAREVGMRKVLGAHRSSLNRLFLTETFFITGAGFLIALLLTEILLPLFNRMMNTSVMLPELPWWFFFGAILVFVGFFGLLAGVYPAWYMGSFQPVKILKGEFWRKPGRFQPRNLLMLLQFVISLGLIVCTLVVFLQLRYFSKKDLGFIPEGVIAVQVTNQDDARLFRQAMAAFPWCTHQSIANTFPGGSTYMEGIMPQDVEPGFMAYRVWTDQHYLKTLGIKPLQGRQFTREDGLETKNILINQALVRKAGWTDPIGKNIHRNGVDFTVIGVVEDYHVQSLHHEVEPLTINVLADYHAAGNNPYWVLIRYETAGSADVLLSLQETWGRLFPGNTLSYHFVNDLLNMQYASEHSFARLFLSFTILAIIIAMLGILGLSAFAARQRQKEFGIRKVLGATQAGIMLKMARDFLKWIVISAAIALPLSYWFMERWLAGFAYAIDFPWWTMAAALSGMIMVALAIVTWQAFNASRSNPVDVLKTE